MIALAMTVPTGPEPSREGKFDGVGGLEIHWQVWLPTGAPKATVVLAHGAGEHCGRYAHVGGALTAAGYSLWALDHRGHGKSQGTPALIDRLDHAVADLRTFVGMASEERPGERPVLFGHSMGGLISTAYALRHQDTVDGLALSAPLLAIEAASPAVRMISAVLTRVAPTLGVLQVDASGVSRDPDVVHDYETDPLVYHGKLRIRTIAELAAEIDRIPGVAATISLPVLIMYGTDDPLVPHRGSDEFFAAISSEDKQLIPYDGLYHEILNEPERDRVLADIVAWLDARQR